jgi:hypothetical protein
MAHPINRRQKPFWQQVRRPMPLPSRPYSTKKGKRGYIRKDKSWKRDVESP